MSDTFFSETCVECDEPCNPDESKLDPKTGKWTCCNCLPAEPVGMVAVLLNIQKRFGRAIDAVGP